MAERGVHLLQPQNPMILGVCGSEERKQERLFWRFGEAFGVWFLDVLGFGKEKKNRSTSWWVLQTNILNIYIKCFFFLGGGVKAKVRCCFFCV